MNPMRFRTSGCLRILFALTLLVFASSVTRAAPNNAIPLLQIKADETTGTVSPTLYGLMTEEINYSYEGGLYGELIGNRTFKGGDEGKRFWSTVGGATISLDTNAPLNDALNWSMKLDAANASKD